MTKHIFITGGVVSSLGKGLTTASIGLLLEKKGLRIRIQKLDPYINVDPGTMSPFQHGEVYVLDDGSETDLDLGHYERFTNAPLSKDCNYTTGKIYSSVIKKERQGYYLGKTVQMIPHITNEIKAAIDSLAGPDVDVVLTELGGTVGDIEGLPFLGRSASSGSTRVRRMSSTSTSRCCPSCARRRSSRPSPRSSRWASCARSASSPTCSSAGANGP